MSESDQPLTLQQVLDQAIQIEEKAGSFYRELQTRFSHHPESAALWKAMAADEDSHAKMLRHVHEQSPQELLSQPATVETVARVLSVTQLMRQDLLSSVRTLRDAYDLAHQLESSEVNSVLQFLVTEAMPGDLEPEFIRSHITAHQRRLTDFRQALDPLTWTRVASHTSSQ